MFAVKKGQTSAAQRSSVLQGREKELYFENQRLNRKLRAFLAKARQNEEKYRRFQELELRLIQCTSLRELLQIILFEYRVASRLERLSLILHDPEYELRRILDAEAPDLRQHGDLIFVDDMETLETFYGLSLAPYLGCYQRDHHAGFFSSLLRPPASIALLPMMRNGELVGSLNLGSEKFERFNPTSASDFLQRLATIVAVCLNNVISQERLKRVGLTDVLTGVNNRRFFDQRLREELSLAQRRKQSLCALFFDVDHFKQVNDRYGHPAGDAVLREVAAIIRGQLRNSDVLARYGGEEFAALLVDTSLEKACEIAERIRGRIEKTAFPVAEGLSIPVTLSVGIACFHGNDDGPLDLEQAADQLMQRADECLYDAKNGGRNQVVCEPPDTAVTQKLDAGPAHDAEPTKTS